MFKITCQISEKLESCIRLIFIDLPLDFLNITIKKITPNLSCGNHAILIYTD